MGAVKSCTGCGVEKPLTDYHRASKAHDGRYSKCKTCVLAQRKAYYENNRAEILERNRSRYKRNREGVLAQQKAYREDNAEACRERARAYHRKRWDTDPEYRAAYRSRYNRRRRLKAEAVQEPYTDLFIAERDGWVCGLCEGEVDPEIQWPDSMSVSIDHIVPLSRGGDDTPANVRLAHLGCNSARGARVA